MFRQGNFCVTVDFFGFDFVFVLLILTMTGSRMSALERVGGSTYCREDGRISP